MPAYSALKAAPAAAALAYAVPGAGCAGTCSSTAPWRFARPWLAEEADRVICFSAAATRVSHDLLQPHSLSPSTAILV